MPVKSLSLKTRYLTQGLHVLLHTVRAIAHAEDELCTLLHAAEHADVPAPELLEELQALLANLPANEYLDDLEAVRSALNFPPSHRRAAKKLSSKAKAGKSKAATARAGKSKAAKSKAGARNQVRTRASSKQKTAVSPKARKAKS